MPDANSSPEAKRREVQDEPVISDAVQSTEFYEIEGGVVFYDAENPLAWLQADDVIDLESAA